MIALILSIESVTTFAPDVVLSLHPAIIAALIGAAATGGKAVADSARAKKDREAGVGTDLAALQKRAVADAQTKKLLVSKAKRAAKERKAERERRLAERALQRETGEDTKLLSAKE